jgi:hypothetical protein
MCSAYVELGPHETFYKILDSYVGIAQVRNNTDQPFKGIVREKYDAVPIKTDKRSSLASLLSQFPLEEKFYQLVTVFTYTLLHLSYIKIQYLTALICKYQTLIYRI